MPLEVEIETPPKVRAKLYVAGHLFATGSVEVSTDSVTFYPKNPKSLAIALGEKIKLKLRKNPKLLTLRLSQELLDSSSESIWFFEIEVIA
jgi:hypothetical protein